MKPRSRIDLNTFRTLCMSLDGPRFQTLTEMFVLWLRTHFADPDTIEDVRLKHLVFRPTIQETGIVIESYTQWKPEITMYRPSLVVKRHAWKSVRIGIDNRGISNTDVLGEHFTNQWVGSHTVFAIAGEGGAAELLGTEVFRELNQNAKSIRTATGLFRLEVSEAGELAKLKEAKEAFAVPVTLGYIAEENWVLAQEAPLLQATSFSVSLS